MRSIAVALMLATGCLDTGESTGPGDEDEAVPDAGPVDEVRDAAPNGILCEARLLLAGRFELGEPQPADVTGCWPVGVWRFSPAVETSSCPPPLDLAYEYAFQIGRDAEGRYTFVYLDDPTYPRVRMTVTSGGGGLCEGGFEVYSLHGTIFRNFKPALQSDGTIDGHADYEVYADDQW